MADKAISDYTVSTSNQYITNIYTPALCNFHNLFAENDG